MGNVFSRSFHIFKESLSVLRKDKEIMLFPILSGIFTMMAMAGMVYAGVITGFFARLGNGSELESNILGYAGLFVWYFVSWFIVIFFNVAVIHCAKIRFEGGDPTVADGFRASTTHLGRIATWALVAATVGLLIRIAADRAKFVGKIVASIAGAAWAIATFFIVPVIIFEKKSMKDSIKQSANLVKKTWGESLVSAGGVGLFMMMLGAAGLLLPIAGMFIGVQAAVIGLGIMAFYWLGLMVVSSALTGIFRAGLYLYATEGKLPQGFTPAYVERAFGPPKGKVAVVPATA